MGVGWWWVEGETDRQTDRDTDTHRDRDRQRVRLRDHIVSNACTPSACKSRI